MLMDGFIFIYRNNKILNEKRKLITKIVISFDTIIITDRTRAQQ